MVAPVAIKVVVCPAQIEAEFILIVGVAVTLTVVVIILEFTQPLALVPVTVNTVVVVGLIEMLFPLTPLDQVYVFAPVTDKVAVCPLQILALFTINVGTELTVTVDVLLPLQEPFEPVTV